MNILYKCLITLTILIILSQSALATGEVFIMKIKGPIGPVTAHYFKRVLNNARTSGANCLVMEMDTPGGLMDSMKDIMQEIINSEIPVVVYVSPPGASATSAGVFIILSSHVAAMAPNTHIGAAHPVMIGQNGEEKMSKEMAEKITNDSVSLIKTTAERKGRNVEWAEKAVRDSISATEKEALQLKVIDIIADNMYNLLINIDGRRIETIKGSVTLHTANASIKEIPMNSGEIFLNIISNPNISYILLILGIYGLIYELATPGAILPGVVGGICIILSSFALGTLPVNHAGLALIIFSFILFIIDIKAPTHGVLTFGGIVSMLLGSLFLFNSDLPYYRISISVILAVILTTTAFFIFVIAFVLKTYKKRVTTGKEGLINEKGTVKTDLEPQGQIMVRGELWTAITLGKYLKKGDNVIVKKIEGLKLFVEPLKEGDNSSKDNQ